MKPSCRLFAASALCGPLLLVATACGPYAQIQKDLVIQSREGLHRVEITRKSQAEIITQALTDRRTRLDDAFDTDILAQAEREELAADYVIESRRAYAAGLDRLAASKVAHDQASATAADNAAAADEALALLERMLTTQSSFLKPN